MNLSFLFLEDSMLPEISENYLSLWHVIKTGRELGEKQPSDLSYEPGHT